MKKHDQKESGYQWSNYYESEQTPQKSLWVTFAPWLVWALVGAFAMWAWFEK